MYEKNPFYKNWNNNREKYFLINYILIDEELEDIEIINENKEDIEKAVEELSKIAQPLSDKLFKKEQAQAQTSTDDDSAKDQTDDAVDAEFKEVDEEKDK